MRTTHVAVRKWRDAPARPWGADPERARLAQSGQLASPRRPMKYRHDDSEGDAGPT
ncbi:hypothetical protein [Sorangium cellulosum]|uniref:hypothetical protein n=1 Tax=Sorangium cellulosum TaxID=56 RepID=UPI0013EE1F52|nr:hypothetical protein [Sorangium cellulosum]